MKHSELRAVLIEELTRIAPDLDAANIEDTGHLREDYDLDSMDSLNLAAAIHKRLGVNIPEAEFGNLHNLKELMGYLEKKMMA